MYFLVDFENVRSGGLRGADYLETSVTSKCCTGIIIKNKLHGGKKLWQ